MNHIGGRGGSHFIVLHFNTPHSEQYITQEWDRILAAGGDPFALFVRMTDAFSILWVHYKERGSQRAESDFTLPRLLFNSVSGFG